MQVVDIITKSFAFHKQLRRFTLHVGFLLLRNSVLCIVESLSLLISFLYLDLYVLGDKAWIS